MTKPLVCAVGLPRSGKAVETEFVNVLAIIEALPYEVPDSRPIHDFIPQGWPTVGDLRKLVADCLLVRKE